MQSPGPALTEYDDDADPRTRADPDDGDTLDQEWPRAIRIPKPHRHRKYAINAQLFSLYQSGALLITQLSCARNSWVNEIHSESTLSWHMRSQRASRWSSSCRRLQAASWAICSPCVKMYRLRCDLNSGASGRIVSSVSAGSRSPLPGICTIARNGPRDTPTASGVPVIPSLPTSPTSTLLPSLTSMTSETIPSFGK